MANFEGVPPENYSFERAVNAFAFWRMNPTPLSSSDEKVWKELELFSEVYKRVGINGNEVDRNWAIETKDKLTKTTPYNWL